MAACILLSHNAEAQKKQFAHVDPPHWWAGMKNANLEILIHFKDITLNTFEIKGATGVLLSKVEQMPNPNYVMLHLKLSGGAPAQRFTIGSRGKAGKMQYTYELKPRRNIARGLDNSDVIYLVTPDRFANGDPTNDAFKNMTQPIADRNEPYARHGGDIQGMINNLGYMQKLGMTALWPNPLLENNQPKESYHGYAFTDYYKIDPRFGSNALYKALADSLHGRGMKLIQDVVYNHIGNEHYLYKDMPDKGWFHLYDTFTQTSYRDPVLYDLYASEYDKKIMTDGWFDKHMPDLNQQNERLAVYLIQQTLWWVEEFDIDALRIDTYAYPDQAFMRRWAKEVKVQYPDLFLFSETWVHGHPSQAWFLGDGLGPEPNNIDGLTDFQIYFAINDALTKKQEWTEGVSKLYNTLAADYIYAHPEKMVTFVDNHDLARFHGYVNKNVDKFRMGMVLLFTMRGIPSIYYGTEILMAETDGHGKIRQDFAGGWPGDPVNKFTSQGRSEDENRAFDLIASLTKLRASYPALQSGKTTQFIPKNGVYIYFRHDASDTFMIAINTSDQKAERPITMFRELVPEGAGLVPVMGNVNIEFGAVHLPALGYGIFKVVK
jgi:glycosidase